MPAKKTATKAKSKKTIKATKAAKPKAKVKKAAAGAAKTKKPTARPKTLKEAMTKTQVLTEIADTSGLSKQQVQSVLDELSSLIELHVKKRSVGHFTLPGLLKVQVVNKPATKARKGRNPFTGEETTFKAKPARNVVKVRPLKKLKDMAA